MSKQFVAWARVSSARQKKEGFSLEDQEQRLNDFATRLGGCVIKLFKIAETASKREERQTFREFTAFVKKQHRRLAGMLFVKVDRAARNIRDWADLEQLSEEMGVPLFFPDQPTAETPAGRMQRRMSAVFASYQTDQQATDIRAGHKRRVENGLPLGRQYGIRLVRVNGRSIVEHDPIDAVKVKRIFELFAFQPLTIETLIDTLARQGIIYTDRSPKFTKSTLHRILHNRIYIGEVWYQGLWHPGKFEPLVDRQTFQAVQDKFGTEFRICRDREITFAGGLIKCGHCGHVITGETKVKKSPDGTVREYTYYRCTHYLTEGHPVIHWKESEIDRQFLSLFDQIRIEEPEIRQWFVDVIKARARVGQDQNQDHRKELQRQHDQVSAKLSTLLELRVDGEIGQEEYAAKHRELHERQSAIRLQLETTDMDGEELAALAIKAFELSQSLKERWVTADYRAKRTILEIMCESVLSNSEKLDISLRKPFNLLRDEKIVPLIGAMGI
ncbi:MAG TPA: recombinase family protein [Tepidisphaeraceae bacterium]|nr:recombinase family protein [Tepidisphaeraceae bacterium]